MWLAVPGRIVRIVDQQGLRMGDVDFGGVTRRVCLAYVPEAVAGDYVIVHAGFAISTLDPEEAARTLELMRQVEVQKIQADMEPDIRPDIRKDEP
jgi:hydrogenase expression/formation protein HypC